MHLHCKLNTPCTVFVTRSLITLAKFAIVGGSGGRRGGVMSGKFYVRFALLSFGSLQSVNNISKTIG